MTAVRGITSRVDIVWSSDVSYINTISGVTAEMSTGNIAAYLSTYTIPLLSTTDDGRVYQCEVVINISPPISASSNITLDTTGLLFVQ